MRKQRIISILLTVALVLSILPMAVAAKDVGAFKDVSTTDWFYDYVKEVASKEYFIGTSDSTFEPDTYMDRAMFATVLARLDGAKVDDSQSGFKDVPVNEWYTGSINWAAENKIVEGVGGGMYEPETNISREEMCAIMDRYVNYYTAKHHVKVKEASSVPQLTDLDKVSDWAKDEKVVDNCLRYGLILGYEDNTFRPQADSTRAEVAAVICRLAFLINNAKPISSGGGSGGSGGGSGGGTEDEKTYTLTLDANGGKVNDQDSIELRLESGKIVKLNEYTLTAPKTDEDEDKIFGGWRDSDGGLYQTTDSIVMNDNKTLVALWIAPDDLLLQAVKASAAKVNSVYIPKMNDAIGGVAGMSIDGTVNLVDVNADDTPDKKVREVNLIAEGKLGADVVDKLLATAVYYGNRFISGVNGENTDDVLTKTEITEMVNAVAAELGITISNKSVNAIAEQVYNEAYSIGSSLWANFKDENGKYYFDKAVVTGADGSPIATVNTNSKSGPTTVILPGKTIAATKKEAATAAAKAIGKQMYASLKTNTTEKEKVDLTATVYVDFSAGLVEQCNPYPKTYTCNVTLTLDSDGLLLYRWDADNNTNILTAVIKNSEGKGGAALYDEKVGELAENYVNKAVSDNITSQLKSDTTYNLVKNGLKDMEVTMTTTQADFAKALTETTDSTGKTVAQNWMDTNVTELYNYLWTQGNPVSNDGKELTGVLNNSALTNAVWDIVKKDIPTEAELQTKVQTQIDNAVAASGIAKTEIVQMAQNNETLKAVQGLLTASEGLTVTSVEAYRNATLNEDGSYSNLKVKIDDFSLNVSGINDINRLLEYQYPVYIKLSVTAGDFTMSAVSRYPSDPAKDDTDNIGVTIENAIYNAVDEKITSVLERDEYAAIKTLYNSDTDVKNYIIYSALTTDTVGLTYFNTDKSQAQGPAMQKLASKGNDSAIKKAISDQLDEKIQSAIGAALNQGNNKTMLDTALEISTYDKAKTQTMAGLGDKLNSLADNLPEKLTTSDSYVHYLNSLIGYLPKSAVITLNGVEITKSSLDALAEATTTEVAVKAAAEILKKFGNLTLENFEQGVSGKVEYNSKDANFTLIIKM